MRNGEMGKQRYELEIVIKHIGLLCPTTNTVAKWCQTSAWSPRKPQNTIQHIAGENCPRHWLSASLSVHPYFSPS